MVESDEEIAASVQRGDVSAFAALVERYEGKMLRYARRFLSTREDAEDKVQDVFLKAYVNLNSFNAKRRFSPWLYRIAHNEFVNAIKKSGHDALPFFDPDVLFPHPIAAERTDKNILERELRDAFDELIQLLDVKYREPLIFYYFEDMSYQEIADILEIPIATVGVRLLRAKEALRQLYEKRHPYGR
ncbi:MAG: RNA polymerase sigma factor [Patescibacteria group bacterium]|jgi:RNA polymerase sigma-70 factor (ECF subfamily)